MSTAKPHSHLSAKKVPSEPLKKVHERCTSSLLRAQELLSKVKSEHEQLLASQHRGTEEEGSTPLRWITQGSPSPQRGASPPTPDVQTTSITSSQSYFQKVLRRLSRSPLPARDLSCTPGKDGGTQRKSVSFASADELESVTPTKRTRTKDQIQGM